MILLLLFPCDGPLLKFFLIPVQLKLDLLHFFIMPENSDLYIVESFLMLDDDFVGLFDFAL